MEWDALKHIYWHLRTQPLGCALRQLRYGFEFALRCGFSAQRAWQHPALHLAAQTTAA